MTPTFEQPFTQFGHSTATVHSSLSSIPVEDF